MLAAADALERRRRALDDADRASQDLDGSVAALVTMGYRPEELAGLLEADPAELAAAKGSSGRPRRSS